VRIIAADALVLACIWHTTYGVKKLADEARVKVSISALLLRHGSIYFGILLLLNIIDIALQLTDVCVYRVRVKYGYRYIYQVFDQMSPMLDVFTIVLISRMLLNLRHVFATSGDTSDDQGALSTVSFATRVIGNLGASVDLELFESRHEPVTLDDSTRPSGDNEGFQQGEEDWSDIAEVPRFVKEPFIDGLGLDSRTEV